VPQRYSLYDLINTKAAEAEKEHRRGSPPRNTTSTCRAILIFLFFSIFGAIVTLRCSYRLDCMRVLTTSSGQVSVAAIVPPKAPPIRCTHEGTCGGRARIEEADSGKTVRERGGLVG
jgi:hypothetical protein